MLRRQPRREADVALVLADARRLALEVAGLAPSNEVDVMALGVVLEPGERASRVLAIRLRVREGGTWTDEAACSVLVTDRRMLLTLPHGEMASLWWGGLVGLDVDLVNHRVTLDYGDARPRVLLGPGVESVAVMAVAQVYGLDALATHPGLSPLRHPLPAFEP
ncbi:hypothetical protein [Terrabacter terrigena]|uniref:Uncharacterized protein n=1 Tax=Terrabacter terrigena TaxID=574718 RepID=A0ABW3MZ90_9MICO